MPRRRRRYTVSSLRSRLNNRLRKKERAERGLFSPDRESRPPYAYGLNFFARMHSFFLLKVVIALLAILVLSILFKMDNAPANLVLDSTRKVLSWNMDLAFFRDEAVPVIKNVFRGNHDRFSFSWGYYKGVLPLDGRVRSQYGIRVNPVTSREEMHYGIDIAGKEGAPVYAILPGKVTVLEKQNLIYRLVIEHDRGWSSVYEGLGEVSVIQGEEVLTNRIIGRLGPGRLWEEPHLHYELRWEGRPRDPLPLLDYKTGL